MLFCMTGFAQTVQPKPVTDADDKAKGAPLLNGYPSTQYYHLNITIPVDVQNSTKKEDRINVFIHNKIVAFEQSQLKPFSSLPKLEMENLLRAYKDEAEKTLYPAPATEATKQPDGPVTKPAIIEK